MFDVIAIGDTTQDIFLQMSDVTLQCNIDGKNCLLCFDYANKIPVDNKTAVSGVGNAANHAVGAARLGLASALYTIVGNDAEGQRAQEVLKENKVDIRYIAIDEDDATNLSVVINYKSERTIFVYHEPRLYHLPEFEPTKWVYLTSASGEGVHRLHEQALRYLEQHGDVKLAFNPGTHQIRLGLTELLPLLQRTDILFLNREESATILNMDGKDVAGLIRGFHDIGVKTMVLTDGPAGAYASDGQVVRHAVIFRGPVVERTGSGDAFGSGFLAAIIKGKNLAEAMLWGNGNSTSVVRFIGSREGLLDEAGMLKIIEQNKDIAVTEFARL